MDRSERFHVIDLLLVNRRCVARQVFLDTLEISPATFKRDLEYLRDRLGAPIVWDPECRGYRYAKTGEHDGAFQLPGLWFNTGELQALLTMNAWLENLQPGILSQHVKPLQTRIHMLLDQGEHGVEQITRRIRVLTQSRRTDDNDFFQPISQALLNRKQIRIRHFNRHNDIHTERLISPQRLTWYRDNWYLDSWCHLRHAIRSFAVDAIELVEPLGQPAQEVSDADMDRELGSGYGIFSGADVRWAELRFSPQRARWVAREQWHPKQKSRFDDDGFYCLSIPYSQETELLMDILRHGAAAEVLRPESLRTRVEEEIQQMAEVYR